jgi:phosphatidylinositol dimannoside acyltransferase
MSARDRVTDAAFLAGWRLVRWLPEPVVGPVFGGIADTVWRRRIAGVAQLERNLRRVVGLELPQPALRELSRAALRSYFRYWAEVFRLPSWSGEQILGRITVEHEPRLREAYASGRGVVIALPHCANWDLAGAWAASTGMSFTTVAERLKPESLFDRFVAYRESLGMEVLALSRGQGGQSSYRSLVERLRAGGMVCLVADRDLTAGGIDVRFFGETARMPAGPASLARATGAALIPATLWYDAERLNLRINEEVPVPAQGSRTEQVAVMTQQVANVFEGSIREHPEDWHMLQPLWLADLGNLQEARR